MSEQLDLIEATRDYAVIAKPYGWLSEAPAPGSAASAGENVPDALAQELRNRSLSFDGVYCIHRLDRTTAGLMVYALNRFAAAKLSAAIQDGTFRKTYRAYLTPGGELAESGELRDWLFFDRRADKAFVTSPGKKGAKEAVLSYRLTGTVGLTDAFGDPVEAAAAEVELMTGRSHQIRIQFGSRKSPLIGDGKYGSRVKYHGPALFSVRLSFPWKNREIVYEERKAKSE